MMGTFLGILVFIFIIYIIDCFQKAQSNSLREKGIKCPYCGGVDCNRVSLLAMSRKSVGKQFKCNKCSAMF